MTRGTNKYHIVRATLESIAYQVTDVLKAMEEDSGIKLSSLKVDGGASANNFLMQFQSDLISTKVERPCCIETTALGAAYLAGLAVGYWENKDAVVNNHHIEKEFDPSMTDEQIQALMDGWHEAVKATNVNK